MQDSQSLGTESHGFYICHFIKPISWNLPASLLGSPQEHSASALCICPTALIARVLCWLRACLTAQVALLLFAQPKDLIVLEWEVPALSLPHSQKQEGSAMFSVTPQVHAEAGFLLCNTSGQCW